MRRRLSVLACALALAVLPVRAELLQVDLSIFGLDCMTCAYVVDAALKKEAGVESVNVSLNKALATVKLKPGNTVSVPQLWKLIHNQGYTPKATTVSVRGEVAGAQGKLQLKVAGTSQILALAADPKNPAAYNEAARKIGQTVTLAGIMTPGKNLSKLVPLQAEQVK